MIFATLPFSCPTCVFPSCPLPVLGKKKSHPSITWHSTKHRSWDHEADVPRAQAPWSSFCHGQMTITHPNVIPSCMCAKKRAGERIENRTRLLDSNLSLEITARYSTFSCLGLETQSCTKIIPSEGLVLQNPYTPRMYPITPWIWVSHHRVPDSSLREDDDCPVKADYCDSWGCTNCLWLSAQCPDCGWTTDS